MNKPNFTTIKINILPAELKEVKKRQRRQRLIVQLSVALLGLMILITGGLLFTVVIQNLNITKSQNNLTNTQNNLNTYKERQALALILRSRLDGVSTLLKKEYSQSDAFNLISALTPADVNLLSFSVDRANKISLSGESSNLQSLDTFFSNIVDPKFNEGKINLATIESLNKGLDKKVRFELSLSLIGSPSDTKPAVAPPPKT